jgi:ferrochelatase
VAALVERLREAMTKTKPELSYRVLFSAHGLPKKIVETGDPYQSQVEMTVGAVVEALGEKDLDWQVCYQSRVGPLEWIGPSTEEEIKRAGAEGKGLIVVPVAFVSEHSETLVELDIEYAELAARAGVKDYLRAATVRDHPEFIAALAGLVAVGLNAKKPVSCIPGRLCPLESSCGQDEAKV